MSQATTTRRRLRVWQRLFIAAAFLLILLFCSTLFSDPAGSRRETAEENIPGEEVVTEDAAPEWDELIYAYVIADEGEKTVPFYSEALTEVARCGRGAYIQIESWEPFVAENGSEYYHVYHNGAYGFIPTGNISDDRSDIIQETQVYVRTPVNLLPSPDGTEPGELVSKGDLLRVVGYDYVTDTGDVNMYEVKLGTDIGWVRSCYVVPTYTEALEDWNNDDNVYALHVQRGDSYGGGDAAELDYWPREKGDFADEGNVMPDSCYSLYIPATSTKPDAIGDYLKMAEGTAINTFVITICDDGAYAFDADVLHDYGIADSYYIECTKEQFARSVQLIHDAGYYVVCRINTFNDYGLASAYPAWSITNLNGTPIQINASYWPSVYSRDVWQYKVLLALEAVDEFGVNEIQFDYVRFPDYIINYENDGTVDLKNTYNESKAQAVQRFLMYAADLIHAHGAYISADVFGETSNDYVAPYGQYWDAISTVVDVISGMPYPDHYSSYYSGGEYYRPYKHPYATLNDWAVHVNMRQSECSTPAVVRTWVQTWSDADYSYNELAIMRQIVALYDNDITGGYMPWHAYGSAYVADNLGSAIDHDYYALYQEASAQEMKLSEYMNIDTSE